MCFSSVLCCVHEIKWFIFVFPLISIAVTVLIKLWLFLISGFVVSEYSVPVNCP